jgi:hypothetical protein
MAWGIAFRLRQQLKGEHVVPAVPGCGGRTARRAGDPLVGRRWEDYLELGVTEIREYGATSVQVARRLRALLIQLLADAPPPHRIAVEAELSKLDVSVAESFPTDADRTLAGESDRQGIGGPARVRPRSG